MNNDVSMLLDVAKKLNAMDIISISRNNVHCRERFFVDNFEPEKFKITGKYLTATRTVEGVDFFALFDVPKPDDPSSAELYRKAVNQFKEKEVKP